MIIKRQPKKINKKESGCLTHALGRELMIMLDGCFDVDITSMIFDPKQERVYPGNDGAYGTNFILTREETIQLANLVDEWKTKHNIKTKGDTELIEETRCRYVPVVKECLEKNRKYRKKVEELEAKLRKYINRLYTLGISPGNFLDPDFSFKVEIVTPLSKPKQEEIKIEKPQEEKPKKEPSIEIKVEETKIIEKTKTEDMTLEEELKPPKIPQPKNTEKFLVSWGNPDYKNTVLVKEYRENDFPESEQPIHP